MDAERRLENQDRFRALANDPSADVTVFCSHDAGELALFAGMSTAEAVRRQ